MKFKYKFNFKFMDNECGYAIYSGSLKECVEMFSNDVRTHKIPDVMCLTSIKNLAAY